MRLARQINTGSFPPSAGQIIECTVTVCHESNPEAYRRKNFGVLRKPAWFRNIARLMIRQRPGRGVRELDAGHIPVSPHPNNT